MGRLLIEFVHFVSLIYCYNTLLTQKTFAVIVYSCL